MGTPPLTTALERLSRRQEDHFEFKASLSYTMSSRPCWVRVASCFEIKRKRRSPQGFQGRTGEREGLGQRLQRRPGMGEGLAQGT